ncbi:MAG: flavin reductase family protein [Pirellulales bacterium]|nr:flavin reductase family protein [Pirellulales bacterium]
MSEASAVPEFAAALGRLPSGIFVLTAKSGADETGMLASWVQQAGFEPPMVTVAIKLGRYVGDWLEQGEEFILNALPEKSHLMKHFGRGFEPGEPAFTGVNIDRARENGPPILTEALAYLVCRGSKAIDSGDHRIYLAEVTGGATLRDEKPAVHIRKNGLHY